MTFRNMYFWEQQDHTVSEDEISQAENILEKTGKVHINEARSRNHFCRRKAVGITCSERDFPPVHTGPGAQPASFKMGTGFFPGLKCGRGVLLAPHHLLVPRSWKSRAIPLPTLWATPGPSGDHFNFTIYYMFWMCVCVDLSSKQDACAVL
jgi:hypothetical protein